MKLFVLIISLILLSNTLFVFSPIKSTNINDHYDLLIITPSCFSEDLIPLSQHKVSIGISTKIVTISDIDNGIYQPSIGRDLAEQIKYFIKYALENWSTEYVLLIGDKDQLPGRYVDICSWDEHFKCFSDLYYADIYDDAGGFCSWDSNGDNIFAGQTMEGMEDLLDLHPDVALGRLLCQNKKEVEVVVNKIIQYETTSFNEKSWFHNIILCGGDDPSSGYGLREGEMYEEWLQRPAQTTWEGEYLCDSIHEIVTGFTANKLYATGLFRSDCLFLNVENINNAINEGAGFLVFVGHGRQDRAIKTNFPLIKSLWLPFPSGYYTKHMNDLQNDDRLPVAIFGGCFCADFDTVKSPVAWEFVKYEHGGSIASFGATTGSQMLGSTLVTDTYMGLLILEIFRFYTQGINKLGDIWRAIIDAYLNNEDAWSLGDDFSVLNWWHTNVNPMVLEEWMLIGDPSLRIGGY